jgi:hypothetical protein
MRRRCNLFTRPKPGARFSGLNSTGGVYDQPCCHTSLLLRYLSVKEDVFVEDTFTLLNTTHESLGHVSPGRKLYSLYLAQLSGSNCRFATEIWPSGLEIRPKGRNEAEASEHDQHSMDPTDRA